MARNLPVAFAAILTGGILVDAAIKGAAIGDVIKGQAKQQQSTGSTGTTLVANTGRVNPFAKASKVTVGRTDQGVDVALNPGDPIVAPADAIVTAINPSWYAGQPQVVLQTADGFMYFAEQLVPNVHVGQHLKAGQQFATYATRGTALEVGFAANGSGETLARATGGYVEGEATNAGRKMLSWLESVGVGVGGGT